MEQLNLTLGMNSDDEVEEGSLFLLFPRPDEEGSSHNASSSNTSELSVSRIFLRHSVGWTSLLIFAYSLIFVIGSVGNILVLGVLAFRPHMRTVTNMFILNLALADLMVITFCLGPTLLSNILIPWMLGPFLCKMVSYIQGISVFVSAYSLCAISFDRFLAIWFPTKMPRGILKIHARVCIIVIWITGSLTLSPWMMVFNLSERDGYIYCLEHWSSEDMALWYFIIGNLILCYALPLCLIIVTNFLIWLHVVNRKVPPESASPALIKTVHRRTRRGVLRMLTVVTLTFLLSWMPLYTLFLLVKLGKVLPENLEVLVPLSQWLGASNSSVNPVIYAFLNKKFRDEFKSFIACHNRANNTSNANTHVHANGLNNSISMNSTVTVMTTPRTFSLRPSRRMMRYPITRV